jgi:signal transduction histidine kinase
MFSTGRLDRFRKSVAARLSLWFAALFAIGCCTIFALLYFLLGRQLEAREFENLRLRLQQYADIYEARGLVGVRERIAEDSEAPNVRSLFVRLVGPRGDAVWGKIPPDWIDQDARRIAVPDGWGGWNVRHVYSVRIPRDQQRDVVVVSTVLPDGLLLQVGRSTDSRETLLEPLRRTFVKVAVGVVLVGFVVGYIAARRATRPLHSVVETARRIITQGALEARVPVPTRDDDIAELVRHFNTVLDKNAALLRSMREALDNVAHDLKTPLTSMRGSAELALGQPGNEAVAREALAECVERADDVLRLLRALMEISEAEAGVLKLNKESCDLGELVRDASELYSDVADAKSISITVRAEGPVPIEADATRLRQAIANLIDNAIKYTPEGGKVEIVARGTDRGTALLEVSDTGPGVPVEEQSRIWERLYRGDQSRSQPGLGLGLSLVRAIVEAHGGQARVRNAPAGGAVFEIELPSKR